MGKWCKYVQMFSIATSTPTVDAVQNCLQVVPFAGILRHKLRPGFGIDQKTSNSGHVWTSLQFKLGRLGYAWLDIQLDMCSVYGTSESNSSSSLSMKFWSTNRLAFGQLELPIRAAQKRGSTTRVG